MTSEGRVDFSRVLDEAFKFSAWEYAPENERQLENLRARVEEAREPAVLDAFNQFCAEGLEARGLALELRGRLDREGDTEGVREWLALMRAALAPRIKIRISISPSGNGVTASLASSERLRGRLRALRPASSLWH